MNSTLFLLAKKLDLNVIYLISKSTTSFGIKTALFVSNVGSLLSLFLLTIALCLVFWLFKKPHQLVQFLITLGVGFLAVYLMKILTARVRPVEAVVSVNGYSFPSGHATIATIFCTLIIFSYREHIKNVFLQTAFVVFFILAIILNTIKNIATPATADKIYPKLSGSPAIE